MIIFEHPFVSDELAAYAERTETPVLKNAVALDMAKRFNLNLVEGEAFAKAVNAGERLYTVSENALDWVYRNVKNESLLQHIHLMKDKYALREAAQKLYPGYFFRKVPASGLRGVNISEIPSPFVLKPSVGFFSMGVHTVASKEDWLAALAKIEDEMDSWKKHYPPSVLGEADFLLEEFIHGDEYAIDVYFNGQGEAVILSILKHDFSSDKDVSDRLYYTSKEIIEARLDDFTKFCNDLNGCMHVHDFPAHIEVRVTEDGRILPIEANPMRFAGWCTTDMADFAFGIKTYDYYLNDRVPDWNAALSGKDGLIYSFVILGKPAMDLTNKTFDFRAVERRFANILRTRRVDGPEYPVFGFLFVETPAEDTSELEYIMRSDLTEFLRG